MKEMKVSFITKEDRKQFKQMMLDCIADALLSSRTIRVLCEDDHGITKSIMDIREDLIDSFNTVKNIIYLHEKNDGTVPKEHVEKARKAFNEFLEAHNTIADFYRAGTKAFADRKASK
jgi:2-phospho-L-lactate guanylyltransferase (CobY/MobA/RfbA family)